MKKRYPFSCSKHAHDLEYYCNHLYVVMRDMESGEIPFDKPRYDRIESLYYGQLMDLMDAIYSNSNGIVWLTGSQFGLAQEIIAWATERRGQR